jgi:hypothetical protein
VQEDFAMPLHDHFRPPLDDRMSWEQFHAQWPAMIVLALQHLLPRRYIAGPHVHAGAFVEVDVGTLEEDDVAPTPGAGNGNGSVATAVWAPPRATLAVEADLPAQDEYEVRVYDAKRSRRLVAAVEIVSPANKDRPEHRRIFVAKCAALLQQQVSVIIVDPVTTRDFNLYAELLELLGQSDLSMGAEPSPIYAAACRTTKKGDTWLLETWSHMLALGRPLPTLPLWLADNFAIPLELEASYEDTCRVFRIS